MFYLKYFFIFCFMGFMFESLGAIFLGSNFNSSVLLGPWTTVYGFGGFIMLFLYRFLKKYRLKKWQEILVFFLISALFLSFLEYLCGIFIYEKLHVIYWDYQNMHFRMGDFNCLEATLFWGIASTLIMYFLYPFMEKICQKMPNALAFIILGLYLIDCLYFFLI